MEAPLSSAAAGNRRIPLLLLLVFLVLAAWARVVNSGSTASLWFDEAWRIQRLLEADSLLRQIVSPPNHIDPPVFSLAIYALARIHDTEFVLRLVSIIPGLLAIVMAWLVGRELFSGRWLPLFSAFLIAFSPWTTIFSKELKPYALGLLVHLAVLFVFLRYRRSPTARSTALFAALLVLALFCSTTIIFTYPGICILMLAMALENGKGRMIRMMSGACATLLAASILYYLLFLNGPNSPQSSENLTTFWRDNFCPEGSLAATFAWFFKRGLGFTAELGFSRFSLFKGAGEVLGIVYPLMALAGAVMVFLRSRKRFLLWFCLFLIPALTMVMFNLLKMWPFGPERMNLFLMAYVVFPPLLLLDEWQRTQTAANRFLPVGLVVVLLMALQFPVRFSNYARQRPVPRQSGEALANLTEFSPEHPPIPLLINHTGWPSFSYYSRHHRLVSKRFSAAGENFTLRVLADHTSRLYTTGILLRQCQAHRQVAVYASHYYGIDRLLFNNEFSVEHHAFDGSKVHSGILESRIAGYGKTLRPLFPSKRWSGENEDWGKVFISRPLPLAELAPGTLVVVNFNLIFHSREKSIQFRFIDQDGSRTPFARSSIENSSAKLPKRIESAVYTRIRKPVEQVRLVIKARGEYDFELRNVTCFAALAETPVATGGFKEGQPRNRERP